MDEIVKVVLTRPGVVVTVDTSGCRDAVGHVVPSRWSADGCPTRGDRPRVPVHSHGAAVPVYSQGAARDSGRPLQQPPWLRQPIGTMR